MAIGWGVFLLAAAARGEVREMLDYIYYDVPDPALSDMTLAQSLDAATPIEYGERPLHGYNRWSIRWHLDFAESERECSIEAITVDLDTLMQLPQLKSSDAEVQARFNEYIEHLQRHLVGHYVVAIQAANKIELKLGQLAPAENCDALQARADQLAEAIVQEHRDKAIAFDKMTDYGAQQGVVVPAAKD
ncbi:DUF922 domain-containing protein [Gilvimarinus sp. DA14]|uniref:DUF922 domain-containing protein n=1 Tax=Gilvimarinus sp. DA14 TaxID=2956798 RepID=UPI0020B81E3C|nr:DUF922 domain-containing protein [Gilvimarinus sp. DA14]UTF58751.1 DUF922 domain-containing Zn-dependent protease [Gilvimarinus sp. DA14]